MCAVIGLVLAGVSCAPSSLDGGFDSANPAGKLYAIQRSARTGDTSQLRQIIEQLDSDDPAVRFVAISTLDRLTGERLGYSPYDPPAERRAAIQRWIEYTEEARPPAAEKTDDDEPQSERERNG